MKIKAVNEIYYYDFARSFQFIEIKLLLLFKNVVIFLLKNMSGLLYGNIRVMPVLSIIRPAAVRYSAIEIFNADLFPFWITDCTVPLP